MMKVMLNAVPRLALAMGLIVPAAFSNAADKLNFPSKPIQITVPYTPGGVADTVVRLVSEELSKEIDQTVVVLNQPGANGMIGSAKVSREKPDGYNLVMVVAAHAINPSLYDDMNYSPLEDLRGVSQLGQFQLLMAASPSLPTSDLDAYIKWAKESPEQATFASSGLGSGAHLVGTFFAEEADIEVTHIPYKGIAPALPDFFNGDISFIIDTVQTLLPLANDERAQAIAVFSSERWPAAPEVPTMIELGYPDLELYSWIGILAPSDTPDEVVEYLSGKFDKILHSKRIQDEFYRFGILPVGGSSADFDEFIQEEHDRWKDLIDRQNISIK